MCDTLASKPEPLTKALPSPLQTFCSILSIQDILWRVLYFLKPLEFVNFFEILLEINSPLAGMVLETIRELGNSYLDPPPSPFPMTNHVVRLVRPCGGSNHCAQTPACDKIHCYVRGVSREMQLVKFEKVMVDKANKSGVISRYDFIRIYLACSILSHQRNDFEAALKAFVTMIPKPYLLDSETYPTQRKVLHADPEMMLRQLNISWVGHPFLTFLLGLDIGVFGTPLLDPSDYHMRKSRIYLNQGAKKKLNPLPFLSRMIRNGTTVTFRPKPRGGSSGFSMTWDSVLAMALFGSPRLTKLVKVPWYLRPAASGGDTPFDTSTYLRVSPYLVNMLASLIRSGENRLDKIFFRGGRVLGSNPFKRKMISFVSVDKKPSFEFYFQSLGF